MKKLVALLLVAMMLVPTMALGEAADGKVINFYCWNDEVQTRLESVWTAPEGYSVNWIITPNEGGVYQAALDEALLNQENAAANDKIDMFAIEADYAMKYAGTDFTLDVYGDVGLTEADTADMYPYTKNVVTSDGKLKGLSWQACPSGMIYRRSYAKEVLGTDDPAEVQAMVSDWDKYTAVAEKMKAAGYAMYSDYVDTYRRFSDAMTAPWVVDGKIQKPAEIEQWITLTKDFTDKGYNQKSMNWSAEFNAGMAKDGKCFSYSGPAWFFMYSMDANTKLEGNESYGDWAICEGPTPFSWGGTWVCAAAGTDNIDIVKDIMLSLTCNAENLTKIVDKYSEFVNSTPIMEAKAADPAFGAGILGDQNYVSVLLKVAQSIKHENGSAYDQTCAEQMEKAMADYFNGTVDLDTAWSNFYTVVEEMHPELSH